VDLFRYGLAVINIDMYCLADDQAVVCKFEAGILIDVEMTEGILTPLVQDDLGYSACKSFFKLRMTNSRPIVLDKEGIYVVFLLTEGNVNF